MRNRSRIASRLTVTAGASLAGVAAFIIATGLARSERAVAAEDTAAGKPYELVAPLVVLMERADEVFYAMPDQLEAKKFKALTKDAQFLAEMANIYSHVKEHREKKEWQAYSVKMKDDLLKLAEAAEKKDAEASKTLHGTVEKTCDGCHEDFRD